MYLVVCSELCQTYKMDLFAKVVKRKKKKTPTEKFDRAWNTLVCIGCLLWQKRYFMVSKLIVEENT